MTPSQRLLRALTGHQADTETAPAATVRAVAWARVSTDMQEARGLSLPEQLREIRRFAEQQGIEIVAEYFEAASAFQRNEKRVEFHRMLADLKERKDVTAILVHDFSRFSRDSVRGKELMRQLRQAGVEIISLSDPSFDPETASGVWIEAITFAKNEAYSREIAFHTKKGCRSNAQTREEETGWCYKNGGQPLFGFKTVQLIRGEEKKGHPIIKSIWDMDDTVVNGKALWEWARECLLMAADGASLDALRDFCNANGLPARRKTFWSLNTWFYMLQPVALLKYTGTDVWNVHRKNGTKRPSEEWTIVENAHPAIITPEEAEKIAAARRAAASSRFDRQNPQRRTSPYALGGGLFTCSQCGSNMVGRVNGHAYYLCGDHEYRKGLGCGVVGVHVRKQWMEEEVVSRVRARLVRLTELKETRALDRAFADLWRASSGYDPRAGAKIAEIDQQIGRVRQAIVDGLDDIAWANGQIKTLRSEREALAERVALAGDPPTVAPRAAAAYIQRLDAVSAGDDAQALKAVLRELVEEITLDPGTLRMEMRYVCPGPITNTPPHSGFRESPGIWGGSHGSGGGMVACREHVLAICQGREPASSLEIAP